MNNPLDNVIGQQRPKQLLTLLGSTFHRRKTLPPIGIFGASGLGKTHLVNSFCEWIGAKQIYVNGTAVKDAMSFRAHIREANKDPSTYHVVFIDECHNLPKKIQENLLSVLEDPAVLCTVAHKEVGNVMCSDGRRWIDKGDVIREKIPQNLSFIFATTDPAMLKETILNRLRKIQLESYTTEDKAEIAMNYLLNHDVDFYGAVDSDLCVRFAERARSIRQLKNDLCETFADVHSLYPEQELDDKLNMVDEMLGIDEEGATQQDLDYMDYLAKNTLAGVDTLAGILKVDKKDVVLRIEPFLIEKGWVVITPKGRVLSKEGKQKMFVFDEEF